MAEEKTNVQKAIDFTNEAVELQNNKKYEESFAKYKTALGYWNLAIKYEQFPTVKEKYKQRMGQVLDDAEKVKQLIKDGAMEDVSRGGQKVKSNKKDKGGDDSEDKALKEAISSAIISEKPNVRWSDVAGLEGAKQSLKEAVELPLKFPQLFVGARKPWKGILLYGPPGTGKSFLAKAVATEIDSTFFSISSSDLMSKWVGQSERLVKALFQLAREKTPSIVFIDEIDSIAGKRGDDDSGSERRVKTELLVQMQGLTENKSILCLGATNTPWDLDPAVIRRFEKRIYIPLPDPPARERLFRIHIGETPHSLSDEDFRVLAQRTEGYSGADISILVRDALMQPVRALQNTTHFKKIQVSEGGVTIEKYQGCSPADPGAEERDLMSIPPQQLAVPKVSMDHMLASLANSKPSVSKSDVERCERWTKDYGITA